MAVIDDIIAQQLRQFPGAPVSPVRALLPQSYADQYTGGLQPADPARATVPGAEEEALQGSNILGDLAQRWGPAYSSFWFRPSVAPHVTNVLSQLAPLALGLSGEGDEGELAEALRGPTRATARFFGEESFPYSSAERMAFKRKFPESAHETYSVPSKTKILPRPWKDRDVTDVGIAEQGERFHGPRANEPIKLVLPRGAAGQPGNLVGPGLYTTDNFSVGAGYGHPLYHIYEIEPGKLKFFDAETPFPKNVLDRLANNLPNTIPDRFSPSGVTAVKGRFQLNRNQFAKEPARKVYARFLGHDPVSQFMQNAMTQALEDEGYHGLRYNGGMITGMPEHNVKVYFRPERDVRMRVIPKEEWRSVYVRDKPIPGYPEQKGWRFTRERVPAPVVAGQMPKR